MLTDKLEYKNSLVELWHTVFGDSPEYIELIFKPEYAKDILCFAELDNGRAVSAFYLIKNTLRLEGKLYNGYYLYAAATLPEYRKYGIMSGLIRQAQLFCRENGDDFISLVPSEESLYSYYSRFGFVDAMYRYTGTYNKESDDAKLYPDETALAEKIRQCYEGNMLYTTGQAFAYCKDSLDAGGASFIRLTDESGALLYEEDGLVLELTSSYERLTESTELLKNKLPCGDWEICSPFELPFCRNNKKDRYGMLYPISDELEREWSFTDIYMNIALD